MSNEALAKKQLNLRVSETLEQAIDEKRVALRDTLGVIPTRSDVLRFALEAYLGLSLGDSESDRRSSDGPAKRASKKQ